MDLTPKPQNAIDLKLISNKELESMISSYLCLNCKKVPLNLHKCSFPICQAYFCDGCFKINNDCCPGCKTKNSNKPISNDLKQLLSKIKFECIHKNKGCTCLISLSDYQDHLNSKCEFSVENKINQVKNTNKSLEFQLEGKILSN